MIQKAGRQRDSGENAVEYLTTVEACRIAGVTYHTLQRAAKKAIFRRGIPKGVRVRIQKGIGKTCPWYFHRSFVENVKSRYAVGSLQPT